MFTSTLRKRGLIGFMAVCCIGLIVANGKLRGRKSPPASGKAVLADSRVPLQARSVLERACQDCHSDNTVSPWYAHVPPVSWQIGKDVARGRATMNFSKWSEYSDAKKRGFMLAILADAKAHVMPPREYVWMHGEAKLSDADLKELE